MGSGIPASPRIPPLGGGVLPSLVRAAAPRTPGEPPSDPGPVLGRLAILYPRLSLPVRVLLPLGLLLLELSPPFTGQGLRRFRDLPPADAQRCLQRWEGSRFRPARQLLRVLVGLVALAAWDDPGLREAIGYQVEEHIQRVNAPGQG